MYAVEFQIKKGHKYCSEGHFNLYPQDISAVKPLVVSLSLFHFGSQFSKIPKVSESNQYISNLL